MTVKVISTKDWRRVYGASDPQRFVYAIAIRRPLVPIDIYTEIPYVLTEAQFEWDDTKAAVQI